MSNYGIGAGSAISGQAEQREPAMNEIIRSLQMEGERLAKNVEVLENRLSPAMAPTAPQNQTQGKDPVLRTLPELLDRFSQFRNVARNANERMEEILRRLEI